MRLSITNFRNIARADIDLNGLVLLAGKNEAGKSSIRLAAALVASEKNLPDGLKKGDAGTLVRGGSTSGSVDLQGDGWSTCLTYPKAQRAVDGKPPAASAFATGLSSLFNMDAKAQGKALAEILKAAPSQEDLKTGLAEAAERLNIEIDAGKIAEAIWKEEIEVAGDATDMARWDGALKRATEKGTKLKGVWESITGEDYGSKKGLTWAPEGWSEEYSALPDEVIQSDIQRAKARRDAALQAQAVNQSEVAKMRDLVSTIPECRAAVRKTGEDLKVADALVNELYNKHAILPDGVQKEPLPCPHCQGALHITPIAAGFKVETATVIKPSVLKKQAAEKMEAFGKLEDAKRALQAAKDAVRIANQNLATAEGAADKLADLDANPSNEMNVEDAEAALADALHIQSIVKRQRDAAAAQAKVMVNLAIVEALKPEGVRSTVVMRSLKPFNKLLWDICETAGWKLVRVESDLSFTYDGTTYASLVNGGTEGGAAYRVRAALQIAMAELDRSWLCVFEGAEVLDNNGMEGLCSVLIAREITAIIALKADAPDRVPDLAAVGVGQTYWLENGTAMPISQLKAAAE